MDDWRESIVPVLERIAVANERIVELATEERQIGQDRSPSFCPHCQTLNPSVRSAGERGGQLDDYVFVGRCESCRNTLFAVPNGWQCFGTAEEAQAWIEGGGDVST